MKPGDMVTILTGAGWSWFYGLRARVVEIHPTHIMATVGDDPRPMRFDQGTFVVHDPPQHHAGAE